MKRNGKELKTIEDGHPRRMSDAKNAWRKMTDDQRRAFLEWIQENDYPLFDLAGATLEIGGEAPEGDDDLWRIGEAAE